MKQTQNSLPNWQNSSTKTEKNKWIDIHTKIQQYGANLHIDAHITLLPWYNSLRESHQEMEKNSKTNCQNTDRNVEFNFHMDDCKPHS